MSTTAVGAAATRALADRLGAVLGAAAPPVETHASIVLLGRDRAWKLKKAVDLGFLDFRALDARRRDCEEEVRLNRRLAPEVYLGVGAVIEDGDRSLRVASAPAATDRIVDWLVEMRRLPAEGMLDRLLAEGAVAVEQVRRFARDLARFHAAVGPAPLADAASVALARRLEGVLERCRHHAVDGLAVLPGRLFDRLADALRECLATIAGTLDRRAALGRVREGHGDLHAGNVCLLDGRLVAYDCLEFDRDLRTADVANDVGFLAMDLDARGAPDLGEIFVDAYVSASGDAALREVLPYFRAHHAIVRAMVEAIRIAEPTVTSAMSDSGRREICDRVLLAVGALSPTVLLLVAGPPLTGKSTLARAIARPLRAAILRSDEVRKRLAGIPPTTRGGEELYGHDATERTYRALADEAARCIALSRNVVVDAAALRVSQRTMIAEAASAAPRFLVWATAERATLEARARHRRDDPTEVSDADLAVAQRLAATAEAPDEWPAGRRILAPAEAPLETHLLGIAELLLRAGRDVSGDVRA